MPEFTIYHSNSIGNKANCLYPHKVTVTDETSFKKAVNKDHVCAKFQNNYRSEKNFISANCIQMDCDNTFSDNPAEWKFPEDVANAFPNVMFAVCYSRNHMKEKKEQRLVLASTVIFLQLNLQMPFLTGTSKK